MTPKRLSRRGLILGGGSLLAGGLVAANWSRLSDSDTYSPILRAGETFSLNVQRLILHNRPLAREYRRDQIAVNHPTNGGFGSSFVDPDPTYDRLVATRFSGWHMSVNGLVARPLRVSLEELRQFPSRTQITMHSCDEGWSAIGEWTGVPLRWLLAYVGVRQAARYIVFHCMDKFAGEHIFGSLDMLDAVHPQTILAHTMNGLPLPPRHGAPVRLRMELQIGYKQLKHIDQIWAVDSLKDVGKGLGGMFEGFGYQWYAGL